jgi:uncharacterized protein YkwD
MASAGHRKNILQEDFTETGIGFAPTGDGWIFVAQVFGRPKKK